MVAQEEAAGSRWQSIFKGHGRTACAGSARGFAASASPSDENETGETVKEKGKPAAGKAQRKTRAKSKEKAEDGGADGGAQAGTTLTLKDLAEFASAEEGDHDETKFGRAARKPGFPSVDVSSLAAALGKKGPAPLLPEGLPKGLRLELLSGPEVTVRPEVATFLRSVLSGGDQSEGCSKRLVSGPRGSGKSVLLALLAACARLQGWVVLYVPTATSLTSGGRFKFCERTGLWDNPDACSRVIADLAAAHRGDLVDLGLSHLLPNEDGAEGDDEESADALCDLISSLAGQTSKPFLVCVDDYNALFGYTGYREVSGRKVSPHDLKSVCALRMLERPEIVRGAAVCSASASLPIRSGTRVASDGDVEEHVAKGLTYEEAVAVWGKRGQSEPKPRSREEQTLRNFVMGVSGNGHAIRDYAAML